MAVGLINIKFATDLKSFSSGMQNANRSIQKMGKKLQNVGAALSVGVTAPLTAFAAVSLKAWDKQQQSIAQVEAGLLSTGNAVGYTSEELQKMASDLQNNSLFGYEEILQKSTAQLLTFTNIAKEQFKGTQQAALDLATRLGGDLQGATLMLGKALNDPVANLSALSRSGIQFSTDQKSMINSLVETNRLADAQTIILGELEAQFGNSASAAAKAGLGPFKQLSNSIGDLTEDFGAIIGKALIPFVDKIKDVVSGFQALTPETKKWIVILGGVAAAIGPILALAGTILPAVLTGFGLLISPIGLIVAGLTAVGVVIYKNWEPIKAQLVALANYFIDLYNESTLFRVAVEGVVLTFKNMWAVGKFALNAIGSLLKGLASAFVDNFKLIGAIVKAVFTGSFDEIGGIIDKFKNRTKTSFADTVSNLGNDWQGLMQDVSSNTATAMANITQRSKIKLLKENVDTSGVDEKLKEITPVLITGKVVSGGKVGNKKQTSISEGLKPVDVNLDIANPIVAEGEKVDTALAGINNSFIDFSSQASQIVTATATNVLAGFGEMIAGLANGTLTLGDVAGGLMQTIGGLAVQLGKVAIEIGIGMLAIKAAFKNPLTAIVAGIALVAIGTLISSASKITSGSNNYAGAFAEGGIVGGNSFAGDKLFARINSGEMVLNQRQQRNVAGLIAPSSQAINIEIVGGLKARMGELSVELAAYAKRKTRTT